MKKTINYKNINLSGIPNTSIRIPIKAISADIKTIIISVCLSDLPICEL